MSESVNDVSAEEPVGAARHAAYAAAPGERFNLAGGLFVVLAFLACGAAVFLPTSAPYSDVINIGLRQRQLLIAMVAGVCFLAGILMLATASVMKLLYDLSPNLENNRA